MFCDLTHVAQVATMSLTARALLALAVSATLTSATLLLVCPRPEDIVPCFCEDDSDYIEITCRHIPSIKYLQSGIDGLKGYEVDELWIEDSELDDIPDDLFNGTSIASITFLNSKITSLGEKQNQPFEGLQFILKGLTITEGFVDHDHPLSTPIPLSHLKRLEYLDLEGNLIPELSNDWFKSGPKSVTSLYVNNCGLKKIGDKAFSELENLSVLDLRKNELKTFPRTALPEKSALLSVLWISENKLMNLPKDTFTNLPSLSRLYLSRNLLTTLPSDTWSNIMPQLSLLFINANPLHCDDSIKWLLNAKTPNIFTGSCSTPEMLAGKKLSSLKEEHFKIFHK